MPAGYRTVTATHTKVSFAVPKGWVDLDPAKANTPEFRKAVEPVAKSMGVSSAEVGRRFTALDLMAIAPEPDATGFAENLNIQKQNFPSAALAHASEAELDKGVRQIGATKEGYSTPQTALGKGAQVDYLLKIGSKNDHGTILLVPNGAGGVSNIAVSSSTRSRTQQVVEQVLATLRATS